MKKAETSLIPTRVNPTPDYYCTWQTQLYATSDGKPAGQRAIIGERALFDRERPYGWAYFYEQIRSDLYLVMDDSWDVPHLRCTGYSVYSHDDAQAGRLPGRHHRCPRLCRLGRLRG